MNQVKYYVYMSGILYVLIRLQNWKKNYLSDNASDNANDRYQVHASESSVS